MNMSLSEIVSDAQRRSRIASELDRREFWKDCFKIILTDNGGEITEAATEADTALCAFESRFMREIK